MPIYAVFKSSLAQLRGAWSQITSSRNLLIVQESPHAVDTLLAEIDIYELFSQRHCEGRRVKVALCDGIIDAIFVSYKFLYYFLMFLYEDQQR